MGAVRELTYKDFKAARDFQFLDRRRRHKELQRRGTRYAGTKPPSTFFRTFSSEYDENGIIYTEELRMLDFEDAMKAEGLTLRDRVRLAIAGDLAISCTCPAFTFWGPAYILTQLDSNAAPPENRFPRIRNPGLRGIMCKHLSLVTEAFPFLTMDIVRDVKKAGYE